MMPVQPKRLNSIVVVLAAAIVLTGCGRTPSEADIKQVVERFMTQENGRRVGAEEPYVNLDRLCSSQGDAGQAEFREVDRVVEIVGPKREMAQGLFHWYAKTIWPVKVALRLQCQHSASAAPIIASQEFELEYDDDAGTWKVYGSAWSAWAEGPTEQDVIAWEFYAAIIFGFAVGVIAAAARQPNLEPGPFVSGLLPGLGVGMFAAIAVGLYVGFEYRILEDDSSPGLLNAIAYGFIGLFVGLFGGAIGGCAGGLGGTLIGRLLAGASARR